MMEESILEGNEAQLISQDEQNMLQGELKDTRSYTHDNDDEEHNKYTITKEPDSNGDNQTSWPPPDGEAMPRPATA